MTIVDIVSFGYRSTNPPEDYEVFDCRHIRNPHKLAKFRSLDGTSVSVKKYVSGDPKSGRLILDVIKAVDIGKRKIAFGCIGGRHRSVAVAEILASALQARGYQTNIEHRCIVD